MFQNFFRGRYGMDAFSYVLLFLALILINVKYVWVIGLASTGYVLFRTLSKNINKRQLELHKFNDITKPIRESVMRQSKKFANTMVNYSVRQKQKKDFVFLKCPKCKKTLRLPRGKGKLQVSCPVCKSEFIKKT